VQKGKKLRFNPRSYIYGRVILVLTTLSLILFVAFGIIFRRVSERHLNNVSRQSGSNIGSIVEGALYHAMLTNDWSALENTINVINALPGIEDVNLYDKHEDVVYSSLSDPVSGHGNPNCKDCHDGIKSMFPGTGQSFRIINLDSECEMTQKDYDYRLLMIHSPILNEPSCYTAACHAHSENDRVLGSFVIRIPMNALDTAITESSSDFFILAVVATLILITFLIFYTRRTINRPLNEIMRASEAVSKGDRNTRLNMDSSQPRDVQLVSETFNKMLDKLQAANDELENWSQQLEYKVQKKSEEISEIQNELIHIERIASLGKLSSSVAHEINNPLSGVLTYTKLVHKQLRKLEMDEEDKEPMLRYLNMIEGETKRCGDIVKGLLDFSKSDKVDFKPLHVHRLLKETYTLIEHQMKIENILIQTDFSATSDLILCNGNQIKQAGLALLMNASEAILENGIIMIKTWNQDDTTITIEITDNGSGIAPNDIPHIFEPFFSTKEKASGIGLGLAIVHGIIQNHNGKISVDSEVGKGTSVSLQLPLPKSPDSNKKAR
jgi:two-component system NtrC family sensor kinase